MAHNSTDSSVDHYGWFSLNSPVSVNVSFKRSHLRWTRLDCSIVRGRGNRSVRIQNTDGASKQLDNWTSWTPRKKQSKKNFDGQGTVCPLRLIILLNFVWINLLDPRGQKNARHLGWGPLGGRDSPATNQKSAPRSRDHHRPMRGPPFIVITNMADFWCFVLPRLTEVIISSQVLTWDVYIVCTHIQTEQCTVYSTGPDQTLS